MTATGLRAQEPTVQSGRELEFARGLLAPDVGRRDYARGVEALGTHLARRPTAARAVLDELARNGSPHADLLRAELLLHCAEGFRTSSDEPPEDAAVLPTDELGRRAATLLDHHDPAVRALAEWAIALRLGLECEGNCPRLWPDAKQSAWFAAWESLSGEDLLDADYMRHAYLLGHLHGPDDVMRGAEEAAERPRCVARYIDAIGSADRRAGARRLEQALLEQLESLRRMVQRLPHDMSALRRQYLRVRRAGRELVLANPDVRHEELVFGVRNLINAHNITQGDLLDLFGAEGEIYVKRGLHPGDPVEPLLRGRLGQGHLRGMDLGWEADRLVFSFVPMPNWNEVLRERAAKYETLLKGGDQRWVFPAHQYRNDAKPMLPLHGRTLQASLYEIDLGTRAIRRITGEGEPYNNDYEPAYLPNGDIVFCSNRSHYGSQCAGNAGQDKKIINLYRCSPDGTCIRPLSNNKDFDRHPRVLDDGRLLFLHWEYHERHLWLPHTLWTSHPDGTCADALYKQHVPTGPFSLRDARQVPGTSLLAAIACGHHEGEVGGLFLVNYAKGINEPDGMRFVTPGVSPTEGGYGGVQPVAEGGVPDRGGYYHWPWPLSEKSFLVAYSFNRPSQESSRNYALYYIDVWGNKELIHRDRKRSITYHAPLAPRHRPPVIPDAVVENMREARVYVTNVNEGLDGVAPGVVKYLRIAQPMPWPCVFDEGLALGWNDLHYNPSGPWTHVLGINGWSPSRAIGVVPVEEDGSAHFIVPVEQPLYFQALDENYLEVRRMRSFVFFQPGEVRGCVGCHQSRSEAVPKTWPTPPQAMLRSPSKPVPPPWGASTVPSFERHIQPILDRYCVRCHGSDHPAGGIELTARKIGGYNQSYRSMFGIAPTERIPAPGFHVSAWHPGDAEAYDTGLDRRATQRFFQAIFDGQRDGQLLSVSNYFSGPEVTAPYQFGSTRSRLITTLLHDPEHRREAQLGKDDWMALVTWIDLNANYFDTYADFKTTPFRRVRVDFGDPWQHAPAGAWIWCEDTDEPTAVLCPSR